MARRELTKYLPRRLTAVAAIERESKRKAAMTTLSIIDCKLTPNSITVIFSEDVTATSTTDISSATNPANYSIQQISPPGGAPQSFETTRGTTSVITAKISYDSRRFAAHITP